jgi:transposase
MVRIEFTEEDIQELRYERFNHLHPRVQLKMEALLLKSQRLEHKQICQILDICHDTLTGYLRDYQKGGIEELKKVNFYRPQSEMVAYKGTLEEEFRKHPPASIKEAESRIKELTGLERSDVQVRKFLKKNGIKTLKSGASTRQSGYGKTGGFFRASTQAPN